MSHSFTCFRLPGPLFLLLQMLSYCWSEQPLVIALKHALTSLGYSVWLDLEQMQGSTLAAMADAVERAAAVVVVFSRRYRESANCRSEAEFAYTSAKHIVPVKAESGYRADGWLGLLIGAKLYFDMSSAHPLPGRRGAEPDPSVCPAFPDDDTASVFCEKVRALARELGPRARATPAAPFCAPVAVARGSAGSMTGGASALAAGDVRAGPVLAATAGAAAGAASPSVGASASAAGAANGSSGGRGLASARSSSSAQLNILMRQQGSDAGSGTDGRSGASTARLARPSSFVVDPRAGRAVQGQGLGLGQGSGSGLGGLGGPSSSPPLPPAMASPPAPVSAAAALPPLRAYSSSRPPTPATGAAELHATARSPSPAAMRPLKDSVSGSIMMINTSAQAVASASAFHGASLALSHQQQLHAASRGPLPASIAVSLDSPAHSSGLLGGAGGPAMDLPSLSPENSSAVSPPDAPTSASASASAGVIQPMARPLLSAPSWQSGPSAFSGSNHRSGLATGPHAEAAPGAQPMASARSAATSLRADAAGGAGAGVPHFPSLDDIAAASAMDVHTWASATTGLPTVADLLLRQSIDGVALLELRRLLASDEGLLLRLLKEDVGIMSLGHRMRLVVALRSLAWGAGVEGSGGDADY